MKKNSTYIFFAIVLLAGAVTFGNLVDIAGIEKILVANERLQVDLTMALVQAAETRGINIDLDTIAFSSQEGLLLANAGITRSQPLSVDELQRGVNLGFVFLVEQSNIRLFPSNGFFTVRVVATNLEGNELVFQFLDELLNIVFEQPAVIKDAGPPIEIEGGFLFKDNQLNPGILFCKYPGFYFGTKTIIQFPGTSFEQILIIPQYQTNVGNGCNDTILG